MCQTLHDRIERWMTAEEMPDEIDWLVDLDLDSLDGLPPSVNHRPAQVRTTRMGRPFKASRAAVGLSAFMLVAGLAHFVAPRVYQRIVPKPLGDAALWVRWTGAAEVGCAALLAGRRTRRTGAMATVALLVLVFPANIKMALDGGIPGERFPLNSPIAAWVRLPLQAPLVLWAWRVARSARPASAAPPAKT